jgi:hypothetical protein
MAISIDTINPAFPKARPAGSKRPLAIALAAIAFAAALGATPAGAGQVGNVDILTRADGRALPVYEKDGRRWIVGTPGQEYAIRVCNTTGARVLAVMSVDGVNVVSGETASPSQAGYVLDAWECAEISGWRKSLSSIAAFYFTELPDSYAARTGRPDNVGVIGVAFFRERQQPVAWKDHPPRIAPSSAPESPARQEAAGGSAMPDGQAERKARSDFAADAARNAESGLAAATPAPTPLAKIGTGHGRNERSVVQTTRFERESATPNETVAFQYDRRENLIAMGILPPPAVARSSNPFPGWARAPYFVPDPPQR